MVDGWSGEWLVWWMVGLGMVGLVDGRSGEWLVWLMVGLVDG